MNIKSLIASCKPGWSLPRPFYAADDVYLLDLNQVWRRGWLFACHSCQVRTPGSYLVVEVDTDSLVVARGEDGQVRAFHNVCRHRGSLVCTEPEGRANRFVCPYHQWTYGLDGALLSCRGMPGDLEKPQLGLKPVQVRETEGMIFISLAECPADFEPARELFASLAKPQGLDRAKAAKVLDYTVQANWKLVWENNRECYHCNRNHPQYIKANFDHYNADDSTPQVQARLAEALRRSEQKWTGQGLAPTHQQTGMTRFPDAEKNIWFSANRTPLVEGYLSETMDGQLAAPLMGDYPDPDVGTLRMRALPNFWNHSSCDHAVSTRLLPAGPRTTRVQVIWLVREEAVEGRDYHLEKLLPFWQLTSEQDWEICERQQRGVLSSAYAPGPYSPIKEYNVESFVRWYLKQLEAPLDGVHGIDSQ